MAHTYSKRFFQSLPNGRKAEIWTIHVDASETWPVPPPGQPAGIAIPYTSFLDEVTGIGSDIHSVDFAIILTPVLGATDKGFMPWVRQVNVLADPDEFAQTEPYLIANLFCWNSNEGEVWARGDSLPAEVDQFTIEILVFEGDDTRGWHNGPVLTQEVTGTPGDQWPLGWYGGGVPVMGSTNFIMGIRPDIRSGALEHRGFAWGNTSYGENPGTSQLASYAMRFETVDFIDRGGNDILAGATIRPFENFSLYMDQLASPILGAINAGALGNYSFSATPAPDTEANPDPNGYQASWDNIASTGDKRISVRTDDGVSQWSLYHELGVTVVPRIGPIVAGATYQAQPEGTPMSPGAILEYLAVAGDAAPDHEITLEIWAEKDLGASAKFAEAVASSPDPIRIGWQPDVGSYVNVFIQARDQYVDPLDDISTDVGLPMFDTFEVVGGP